MYERSFYKVVIGSKSGGKFVWRNDCRKIEGAFGCSLVKVSKSAAQSLSMPPGYTAGAEHAYFVPSVSGTPSYTSVAGDLKSYDCTGCAVGGNQFLLTDHSLGLYCMTEECAVAVLSRMFYFDANEDHASWRYAADGSDFDYKCEPYLRCMYGNAVVRSIQRSSSGVAFTLEVSSKDPSGVTDVRHAYRLVEVDTVYGGFFMSGTPRHRYTYETEKTDARLLQDLASDWTKLDVVVQPSSELVQEPVAQGALAGYNYSFLDREHLVHAGGTSDPIYDFVYCHDVSVLNGWSNQAYKILPTVSRRTVQGQVSSDPASLVSPNRQSDEPPTDHADKYPVFAWENITSGATSLTASTDRYQHVRLVFTAIVVSGLDLVLERDGEVIRRFGSGTWTHAQYNDWTMDVGVAHQYRLYVRKKDFLGWNYGSVATATGSTASYDPADVPGIGAVSRGIRHIGVAYSWEVPVPGAGFELAGYAVPATPSPSNSYSRFADYPLLGIASQPHPVGHLHKRSAKDTDLYVKYTDTATGNAVYSSDPIRLGDRKPVQMRPELVVVGLKATMDARRVITVRWTLVRPTDTVPGSSTPLAVGSLVVEGIPGVTSPAVAYDDYEYSFQASVSKEYEISVTAVIPVSEFGYTDNIELRRRALCDARIPEPPVEPPSSSSSEPGPDDGRKERQGPGASREYHSFD